MFHHGRRQREVMGVVQRIQHAALQVQASGGLEIAGELFAHAVLQRGQIVQAQLLGQLVVDRGVFRNFHFLDGHREDGVFACHFGGMVFGREGDLHVAALTGGGADQLVFEARNKRAGAKGKVEIGALAAIERHAVDAAFIIDHHHIILGGGAVLGLVVADVLGQAVQRFVHVGVGDVGGDAFHRQLGRVGGFEFRHQIHDHLEGEVGLAIDHVFHAADRFDARLQGRLELVVGDGLLAGFIDGGFHHFAHDGLAELLLEE